MGCGLARWIAVDYSHHVREVQPDLARGKCQQNGSWGVPLREVRGHSGTRLAVGALERLGAAGRGACLILDGKGNVKV